MATVSIHVSRDSLLCSSSWPPILKLFGLLDHLGILFWCCLIMFQTQRDFHLEDHRGEATHASKHRPTFCQRQNQQRRRKCGECLHARHFQWRASTSTATTMSIKVEYCDTRRRPSPSPTLDTCLKTKTQHVQNTFSDTLELQDTLLDTVLGYFLMISQNPIQGWSGPS